MNRVILNFTAYFLIPLSTVLFAWDSNWFTTNFSVLSNGMERKNAFAFWGLLVGVYFFCILHQISRKMFPAPRGISLISLSLLLLVCGVVTPYLPEIFPFPRFCMLYFLFLPPSVFRCFFCFYYTSFPCVSRENTGFIHGFWRASFFFRPSFCFWQGLSAVLWKFFSPFLRRCSAENF